ncbi:ribonuclease P [Candidatus Micrarchaeota archaeon]|nr:ribonuclease P [Candidatus Micrarchaeota archaeon]
MAKLIKAAFSSYRQGNNSRSKRYAKMAFELIKKHKIHLPEELKNSFCKKCLLVWLPGTTITTIYDSKNNCLRIRCHCGYSKRV